MTPRRASSPIARSISAGSTSPLRHNWAIPLDLGIATHSRWLARSRHEVRDLLQLLEQEGWRVARTRGSHRQLKHAAKPGTVTVAGKPSADVPPGTLRAILKQARLQPPRTLHALRSRD